MDRAVHEDPSVALRVLHEEACCVKQIARVGSDEERFADGVVVCDFVLGIAVRRIETSREAGHNFQLGMCVGGIDDLLSL